MRSTLSTLLLLLLFLTGCAQEERDPAGASSNSLNSGPSAANSKSYGTAIEKLRKSQSRRARCEHGEHAALEKVLTTLEALRTSIEESTLRKRQETFSSPKREASHYSFQVAGVPFALRKVPFDVERRSTWETKEHRSWRELEVALESAQAQSLPFDHEAWQRLLRDADFLLRDDLLRLDQGLSYSIHHENFRHTLEALEALDRCRVDPSCQLSPSEERQRQLLAASSQRFRFVANERIAFSGRTLYLPIDFSQARAFKGFVSRIAENGWSRYGLNVEIVDSGRGHRLVVHREQSGRPFVNKNEIHLFWGNSEGQILHEIGHLLGLGERYFSYFDTKDCRYKTSINRQDVMSSANYGNPTRDSIEEVFRHYR